MITNSDECEKAGLDEKEVARIAKGIERYMKQAEALGMKIFGGSDLTLRFDDGEGVGDLIVAMHLANRVDGGCGSTDDQYDGLLRGEWE